MAQSLYATDPEVWENPERLDSLDLELIAEQSRRSLRRAARVFDENDEEC